MGTADGGAHISGDDSVGRDAAGRNLFSVGANNVLEAPVLIKKSIPVMVADDHASIAYPGQLGIGILDASVVQRGEAAIAINESMRNSAAISRIQICADNYSVVIEPIRASLLCSWKVGDTNEGTIAAALKDVAHAVAVCVTAKKRVQIVDRTHSCAVVGRLRVHDQGCRGAVKKSSVPDSKRIYV